MTSTEIFFLSLIGQIATAILVWLGNQQNRRTHTLINSRMDELLNAARTLAHARGAADARAEDRAAAERLKANTQ